MRLTLFQAEGEKKRVVELISSSSKMSEKTLRHLGKVASMPRKNKEYQ